MGSRTEALSVLIGFDCAADSAGLSGADGKPHMFASTPRASNGMSGDLSLSACVVVFQQICFKSLYDAQEEATQNHMHRSCRGAEPAPGSCIRGQLPGPADVGLAGFCPSSRLPQFPTSCKTCTSQAMNQGPSPPRVFGRARRNVGPRDFGDDVRSRRAPATAGNASDGRYGASLSTKHTCCSRCYYHLLLISSLARPY